MNVIKIYLKPSGSTAELEKHFKLYQNCYRNVQISVFVPIEILYGNADNTFYNTVQTGAILTAPNGIRVMTQAYNAVYVGTAVKNGIKYAEYTQVMPKEYAVYAGKQVIVCNVANIDNTNAQTPKIISVTTTQEVTLVVHSSAYLLESEPLEPSESEVIEGLVNDVHARLNDGAFAARAIYPWSATQTFGKDELVFYPDAGDYGVFLKSLTSNNKSAPYVNGVLDTDNWLPVSDFNILTGLYSLKEDAEESEENAKLYSESAAQSALIAQNAATSVKAEADYFDGVKGGTIAVPKALADGSGNSIASQFSAVNSDIAGIRQDLANEAHFRGYLATDDEIEGLSGTPNDYAYSAESGSVWIYQTATGWTDSQKAVPDQTVPPSSATPLADGEAGAGVSCAYARGDHRHPTDETRASVAALNAEETRAKAEEAKKADKSGAEFTGAVSAPTVTGENGVYDGGQRVYSPDNPPPTGVAPSNDLPLADGTASAGSGNTYARGDHRHPKQPIDAALSTTSTNPVQNKVVAEALNGKVGYAEFPVVEQNWVEEEWAKSLNLADDREVSGKTIPSNDITYQMPFTVSAGTYTVKLFIKNDDTAIANTFAIYLRNASGTNLQTISFEARPNTYNTFSVTASVAAQVGYIAIYFNYTNGSAYSGKVMQGMTITRGSAHYPYKAYCGEILRKKNINVGWNNSVSLSGNTGSSYSLLRSKRVTVPTVVTVWARESAQQGSLLICNAQSTSGANIISRSEGANAYWGATYLNCTALVPAGQTYYVYAYRVQEVRYSETPIFAD